MGSSVDMAGRGCARSGYGSCRREGVVVLWQVRAIYECPSQSVLKNFPGHRCLLAAAWAESALCVSAPYFYISPVIELHHSRGTVRSGVAGMVFSWGEQQGLTRQTTLSLSPSEWKMGLSFSGRSLSALFVSALCFEL